MRCDLVIVITADPSARNCSKMPADASTILLATDAARMLGVGEMGEYGAVSFHAGVMCV